MTEEGVSEEVAAGEHKQVDRSVEQDGSDDDDIVEVGRDQPDNPEEGGGGWGGRGWGGRYHSVRVVRVCCWW